MKNGSASRFVSDLIRRERDHETISQNWLELIRTRVVYGSLYSAPTAAERGQLR